MKNSSIKINLNSINDQVIGWKNKVDNYCDNKPSIKGSSSDGFTLLKDAGFSDNSFNTFDSNIEQASFAIKDFYKVISEYLSSMNSTDTEVESKVPSPNRINNTTVISSFTAVEQSSLRMDDLSKERETIKNSAGGNSNYDGSYNRVIISSLYNVNNSTAQKSEYTDNTVNEKKVALKQMKDNKTTESLYDSNSIVNKQSLNEVNTNNYTSQVYYDSSSSVKEKKLNEIKSVSLENVDFDGKYSNTANSNR